ncbi:O-antigen ligase family protein [Listeria grandensis]|uniref:O-antigen ligase family protein n=1 Tax=Listeria grandensis TaxID=1494963 RepID=UPI003B9825FB
MALLRYFRLLIFLNGLFLTSGISVPIGVGYRFVFLLFLIIAIGMDDLPKSALTYVTFLFIAGNLLIWLLQGIFLQNPLAWMMADLSVFIKYFLWVLIPYYIYQRKSILQTIRYEELFIVISFLFTTGLLIPYVLGVGYQTYDNSDAGYKGYFFANNDTSFAFIISITFTARALWLQLSGKWNMRLLLLLILYAGNIVCLLLVGTKTGILYGVIVSIFLLVHLLFGTGYRSALHRIMIWMASFLAVGWVVFRGIHYAAEMVEGTYERIVYFYHLYDGNLVRLLTSSRSDFLESGMMYFLEDTNFGFSFLFGQGFEYRLENFGRFGLIEMDFFDGLFGLGVLGILLLIVMLGYFLWLAFSKGSRSIYSYMFLVIVLYSFFAGHVLFSALSSTFLGLVCGGIILSKKE